MVQALRLWGWHHAGAWRNPMLAVLYAGYLWLVLGLALDALAGLGWLPPFPALHALTAGAFGVFTLGMMARVTLGHTGREVRGETLTSRRLRAHQCRRPGPRPSAPDRPGRLRHLAAHLRGPVDACLWDLPVGLCTHAPAPADRRQAGVGRRAQ